MSILGNVAVLAYVSVQITEVKVDATAVNAIASLAFLLV
jgi:hypothetical protein